MDIGEWAESVAEEHKVTTTPPPSSRREARERFVCRHCLNIGRHDTNHATAVCPVIATNRCEHCSEVGHLPSRCPMLAFEAVKEERGRGGGRRGGEEHRRRHSPPPRSFVQGGQHGGGQHGGGERGWQQQLSQDELRDLRFMMFQFFRGDPPPHWLNQRDQGHRWRR